MLRNSDGQNQDENVIWFNSIKAGKNTERYSWEKMKQSTKYSSSSRWEDNSTGFTPILS